MTNRSLEYRILEQTSTTSGPPNAPFIAHTADQAPEKFKSAIDWDKEYLAIVCVSTPTPGHIVNVKSVVQDGNKLQVATETKSPGGMQLTVIANKTVVIAVKRPSASQDGSSVKPEQIELVGAGGRVRQIRGRGGRPGNIFRATA